MCIRDSLETEPLNVDVGPTQFAERIEWLADHYRRDEKIESPLTSKCAKCEFRTTSSVENVELKSGFQECWQQLLSEEKLAAPTVLEIWDYREKDRLLSESRGSIHHVSRDDINPRSDNAPGLSKSERQWLQVQKAQSEDTSPHIDRDGLRQAIQSWTFPLHFIDFETSQVAIPMDKGRRPYEMIAFQFSHHTVTSTGEVKHQGEYLNTSRGVFPNYEFVRQLKRELEHDVGSIFRYSNHENTTLLAIYRQLVHETSPPEDRDELMDFIRSITKSNGRRLERWTGDREMIDLWELVKRFYYSPRTKGSNSIKYVLPAILSDSDYLQSKYSQPIYGAMGGIPSFNFENKRWIEKTDDGFADPYQLIPKMYEDLSDQDFERFMNEDVLDDGLRQTSVRRNG